MQQINNILFPILTKMENREVLKNKTAIENAINFISVNLFRPGFRNNYQEDIKRFANFLNSAELNGDNLSDKVWKACQIFHDAFPDFFEKSEDASTIVLVRGTNHDYQETLPRNCILMRSPAFWQQLASLSRYALVLKPSDGVDYREEAVKELFTFLKSGKISDNCDTQTLGDLIRIAKQHQLEELLNLCVANMKDNLSAANCVEVIQIACKHDLRQMILNGLFFIQTHSQDFNTFAHLNRDLFQLKSQTQKGLIDLDILALMENFRAGNTVAGAKFNLHRNSNGEVEVELLNLPSKQQSDESLKLICPKEFCTFLFRLNALHPINLNTTRCFNINNGNILYIQQTTGIKKFKITTDAPHFDVNFINQLEEYGNKGAFLHTFKEAEKYVKLFANSKCQLTDLNVRRMAKLSDEKLQTLVNKLPGLKYLYLNDEINITTLPNLPEGVEIRWSLCRPVRSSYSNDIYYLDIQSIEELERHIFFYQLAKQENQMNLHWDLRRLKNLTDEQLERLAKKVPNLKGLVVSSEKLTKIPFENLETFDSKNKNLLTRPQKQNKTIDPAPQAPKIENLSKSVAKGFSLGASGSFPKKLNSILQQQRLTT